MDKPKEQEEKRPVDMKSKKDELLRLAKAGDADGIALLLKGK